MTIRPPAALLRLALPLLLALLPVAGSVRAQDAPPPEDAPPPRETPPAEGDPAGETSADQALLEDLVRQAVPIVEAARGGKFKKEVPAAPVTAEKFVEKYFRDLGRGLGGEEKVAAASRLLVAMGVLEPGSDLRAILGDFLKGNIAANYDPETGRISFLPGAHRTLFLMAHEMTHAYDDQHFDMGAQIDSWNGSWDRALAYGALCEGNAESVEFRTMTGGGLASQPLDGLKVMANAQADAVLRQKFGATPPAIVLAFKSQYIDGLLFVENLRRSPRKEEAVDDAFRRPPCSTEQILHPEKYAAGEGFTRLTFAAPEGAALAYDTSLGEIGTATVLVARGVERARAVAAAAGWGGDTAALVRFPAEAGPVEALAWVTAWDTDGEAKEFKEVLEQAFPVQTGQASDRLSRMIVLRQSTGERPATVEFVQAPLDFLPSMIEMARAPTRNPVEAPPRENVLPK